MVNKRTDEEVKRELEILNRLADNEDFQVFCAVLARMRVNLIRELLLEQTSQEREEVLLGTDEVLKNIITLKKITSDRLVRLKNKGRISAIDIITVYMRDIRDRLFTLIHKKDIKQIKETYYNDNSLET